MGHNAVLKGITVKVLIILALALSLPACGTRASTLSKDVNDVKTYTVTTVDGEMYECFSIKQGTIDNSWGGIHCVEVVQ